MVRRGEGKTRTDVDIDSFKFLLETREFDQRVLDLLLVDWRFFFSRHSGDENEDEDEDEDGVEVEGERACESESKRDRELGGVKERARGCGSSMGGLEQRMRGGK